METSSDTVRRNRPHILMVTTSLKGHFPPFVQLLYRLADFWRLQSPHDTCIVTVVGVKEDLLDLKRLQFDGAFRGVDLRLLEMCVEIFQSGNPKRPIDPLIQTKMFQDAFEPLQQKMIEEKKNGGLEIPTCLIPDFLLTFTKDLAESLEIPWIPFFHCPAWCTQSFLMFEEILDLPVTTSSNDFIPIPGLQCFRQNDIASEIWVTPEWFQNLRRNTCNKWLSAVLFNTAPELEGPGGALNALQSFFSKQVDIKQVPKLYTIGPMLQLPGFGAQYTTSIPENDSCLQWLDMQAEKSVLYISFGTLGNLNWEEMRELAHGLEASGVAFLWILKVSSPAEAITLLTPGFLDRTRHRGFIHIGWAPQTRILSHWAVGGFISHCGWNSIMESISNGVPIISWPVFVDQPMNARFISDVAKVGVPVMEDFNHKKTIVSRTCVEKAIRTLMFEKTGTELRYNAVKLKEVLTASVAEGGSSHANLRKFLQEILMI
ncbi:protein MpUGT37 [Marchantia polymorpha subsp. ruderalis]